jgi:hypothetical protein
MQTSYTQNPDAGRAGDLRGSDDHRLIERGVQMDGAVQVGILSVLSDGKDPSSLDSDQIKAMPALAVSANAVLAATASAAAAVAIDQNSAPALQIARLSPARRVTATLSAHANWDATKMRVYGYDVEGRAIKEEMIIPDGGGVTLTTHQFFARVTKVELDAQSGTGGSFTMGYTADEGIYSPEECGILLRPYTSEPLTNDSVDDKKGGDWLKKGRCLVAVEATVSKGDNVFVRTLLSGQNVRGQLSNAPGAGFSPLPHAKFSSDGDTTHVAEITLS